MRLFLIWRSPPGDRWARRVGLIVGGLGSGLSLRASLPVQRCDGPRSIKASAPPELVSHPKRMFAPLKRAFVPVRHDSRIAHPRTPAALAVLLAVSALAACGAGDDAGNPDSELTPAEATAPLEGAPPELAAIRDQANEVLDEGAEGFEARLAELEGTPVVVNKWASWCGPCRLEFPWFQRQAADRAKEVAFLGVGANDSKDALTTFLEQLPLPYPTYYDPDLEIARELGGPRQVFPATAFFDRRGELAYTHAGVYEDEAALVADIDRYAR